MPQEPMNATNQMEAGYDGHRTVLSGAVSGNKNFWTGFARLVGALMFVFGAQPALAQEGCGSDGVYGHVNVQFTPASDLAWVKQGTIAALLCNDGNAQGGGFITLVLDYAFVNADPKFELPVGTEMTFWAEPFAWVTNIQPLVAYHIHPTGKFRKTVLAALNGDEAALEDWTLLLSSRYPTGEYDLDGNGLIDLRIKITTID